MLPSRPLEVQDAFSGPVRMDSIRPDTSGSTLAFHLWCGDNRCD